MAPRSVVHCWHLTGQRMPSVIDGGATWQTVRCCWCNTSQTVTFFDAGILSEGHGPHHPGFEERYRLDPEWHYAACPARRATV